MLAAQQSAADKVTLDKLPYMCDFVNLHSSQEEQRQGFHLSMPL